MFALLGRTAYIFDRARSVSHSTRLCYNLVDVRPLLWALAQHRSCLVSVHAMAYRCEISPINVLILSENGG